jgi:hypothetical protein
LSAYRDPAAFYRAALLLGLVRGDEVVRWADDVLGGDSSAPGSFVEIATTSPDDLTSLRERLFAVAAEKESADVVRRLIGLVQRDLASGRRTFHDTMTVLKQFRAFLKLDRDLNEQLKTLGVDVAMAPPGSHARVAAEQRVRDWLQQHAC